MTTMGVTVYCNRVQIPSNDREQMMLLRTLQDNESNILGNRSQIIAPKSVLVSNSSVPLNSGVISNTSVQQQVTTALPAYDPTRLKKHGKNGQPPPVAVARRNARERNRVKQVNDGFTKLRSYIPSHVAAGYGDRGKKLSKVETLRMAVEYIRGLKKLLAEADGVVDYDLNVMVEQGMAAPSPTGSILSSSTHNGSGERLCLEDEVPQQEEEDGDYLLDEEEDDEEKRGGQRTSLAIRLSPNLRTSSSTAKRKRSSPINYYPPSVGDEENVEPKDSRGNFSRFSPTSIASSVVVKNEFCTVQNEENLHSRIVLTPYSGTTEIVGEVLNPEEEQAPTVIYTTSPEPFSGALYYKHEPSETGEFMDVVSWWEQEQGRLVHHTQPHAQRLTHV